jgi:drug/metabolite transporter (DMT)-like permease
MHATWNALSKRVADPLLFLWWALVVGLVPLAIAAALIGGFDPGLSLAEAWPLAASSVVHAVYFYSLGRAYRLGDLSQVYPVARGLSVALVAGGSSLILAEPPNLVGGVGIAVVVAGVLAVGWRRGAPRGGLLWAILTGVLIASYSLIDKVGVGHIHPVAYLATLNVGAAVLLAPLVWRRRAHAKALWHERRRSIALAALFTMGSYVLVLSAFRMSAAGYVVATRELSVAFSVAIGYAAFAERVNARRIAGALAIAAGTVLVALA